MPEIRLLKNDWQHTLSELISSARNEIVISSPFVTIDGVRFVQQRLSEPFRKSGAFNFVTNLSPINQIQGVTDPAALRTLSDNLPQLAIYHLPRLHAKAYIFDNQTAVITSGNLTSGGLNQNYEYGVLVTDSAITAEARNDILDYADLGTQISREQLVLYCAVVEEAANAFKQQQLSVSKIARERFEAALQTASDELLRLRLSEGTLHAVLNRTVLYLLNRHESMSTEKLHLHIQQIHPDLCDDSVDRVINGVHFGKKWKHAVRTSQQYLKQKGLIELVDGRWQRREYP